MNSPAKPGRWSGVRNVALWVLQALTAAAFLLAGVAKLTGQPMMVENFEKIGVGRWFLYLTAAVEIGSAVLLLIPRLAPAGAALLVCTMAGAVLAHLTVLHGSALPAVALGGCAAVILWGRFRTVKAWLASARRSAAQRRRVQEYRCGV